MLGDLIKETRIKRGLSQREFAKIASVSNSLISKIEDGKSVNPSFETLTNISRALNMLLSQLKRAMQGDIESKIPLKTPHAALRELTSVLPIAVPVIANMRAPGRIMEYLYIPKSQNGHKNFYGVMVQGDCLAPEINNGDIVIIDKDEVPEIGKSILCYHNGEEHPCIKKIKEKSDVNDCEIYGVILWIMKKP